MAAPTQCSMNYRAITEAIMSASTGANDPAQAEALETPTLEQIKKDLRAQFTIRPLTAAERRAAEDEAWATHDDTVQTAYRGEFVVPFGRRIIAHGTNAEQVLKEAAAVAGCDADELPLLGIDNPLSD